MIDFSTLQGLAIPEGVVTQIEDASGRVIWMLKSGNKVVLQVEKITSDTYAGETLYENEQFILLDIYPKTNGTVKVTYGGLTKTITDTSGAEEPNAQQVFFGTFNGVSDSMETPSNGGLVIEGNFYAFGIGHYTLDSAKVGAEKCSCITEVIEFGKVSAIPINAFYGCTGITISELPSNVTSIGNNAFYGCTGITRVIIPDSTISIGNNAFYGCKSLNTINIGKGVTSIDNHAFAGIQYPCYMNIKAPTPPTVEYLCSMAATEELHITVPKGCGEAYKSATGWEKFANYIVEAS